MDLISFLASYHTMLRFITGLAVGALSIYICLHDPPFQSPTLTRRSIHPETAETAEISETKGPAETANPY